MGVHGLWRLIDATGKPVPLESLEGKVLAVDVSIWIHQVIQGYQDRKGSALPNAHLIGLFNRICKLMYYKIRPVFVFDGGVPMLKKNTIAFRRKQKSAAANKAQKLKNDLINNLIKHTAVKSSLDNKRNEPSTSQVGAGLIPKGMQVNKKDDMFRLPELPVESQIQLSQNDEDYDSSYDSSEELSPRKNSKWIGNIHNVDVNSQEFKNLPADVRYDILTDLKETRKQNSWGRLHEMPEESQGFSDFQMKRLLKRRHVQESLEQAEMEMGGKSLTLEELDKLMTEQGISTKQTDDVFRIASDNTTRIIYISDRNALQEKEKMDGIKASQEQSSQSSQNSDDSEAKPSTSKGFVPILENIDEYDLESNSDSEIDCYPLENEQITEKVIEEINIPKPSTSTKLSKSFIDDIAEYGGFESDWESESEIVESIPISKDKIKNPAVNFMMEYSNLSQEQILKLVHQAKTNQTMAEKHKKEEMKRSRKTKRLKKEKAENSSSESDSFDEVPLKARKKPEKIVDIVSDIYGRMSPICENKFIKKNEKDEVAEMSSSTDSDDFVVIEDVPIPESDKRKIEIIVNPNQNMEDDLFADVFNDDFVMPKIEPQNSLTEKVNEPNVEVKYISEKKEMNNEKERDNGISKIETKVDLISNQEQIKMNEPLKEKVINLEINGEKIVETIEIELNKNIQKPNDNDGVQTEADSGKNAEEIEVDSEVNNVNLSQDEKVSPVKLIVLPANEKELQSMKSQLEDEMKQITGNIGKLERQATDITEQMRIEAQELLQLFGIPYVVAPMEAEAQCAYLENCNLTHGTITDDSDIWLFGGKCVYKNFFDNNKNVLQFLDCDIKYHYNLTRQQMIQLALLVGSDYTNGIAGIGPVTALEILAAFPTSGEDLLRGLTNFATWMSAGKTALPGKGSLRSKLRNVIVEKGFPNQAVAQAYLYPTIDDSKELFSWGKPNLILIADYTRQKFGWTRSKFEEIINPVMKKFLDNSSQKTLLSYYKLHAKPKSIENCMSKRVQSAVQRLALDNIEGAEAAAGITDEKNDVERKKKPVKRANKKKVSNSDTLNNETVTKSVEEEIQVNEQSSVENKKRKALAIVKNKADAKEVIPQRELDKANALNKKLKAIEVFRKSKKGMAKTTKVQKQSKIVLKEAHLSESDDSS